MDEIQTKDLLEYDEQGKAKMPTGLNVLTILTFIGCGIFGLLTLLAPVIYKFSLNMMEKAKSSGQELSEKQVADMAKGKAAIELAMQNMIPTMIIGMAGIILCFVGALWMRKYKKDGYWMYVAGELAPIIASIVIVGTSQLEGFWGIAVGIVIPVTFVILYTLQRKYLTK